MRDLRILLLFLVASSSVQLLFADDLFHPPHRLWKSAPDDVYLQEVAEKITTTTPVLSVALHEKQLYAVIDKTICKLENAAFAKEPLSPTEVDRLICIDNNLWALTSHGLYQFKDNTWTRLLDEPVIDLCAHLCVLHAATREDLFKFEDGQFINIRPKDGYLSSDVTVMMADGSQVLADPVRLGPLQRIQSYSGTLYALRPGQIILLDGRKVDQNGVEWGALPSLRAHDLLAMGSRLFIATDRGLAVLRGAALTSLRGSDGLPCEETTCLAQGFADDLWIGTTTGAVRMLQDDWHYFGPYHWLPGENVHAIAVGQNIVAIATDSGVGIIRYEPYTLAKKAAYYERHLEAWGHKRLGFIHTLYKSGDKWIREISDNDGGHTAPYLAAMCFKYAVTGDEAARREAVDAFMAMVWLEQITPKKGFIARAIWSPADDDERARHGSGGLPAKWYPEDGQWYWKGDTSSDEVDAHFYAVSLFHDLVARGREKELARQHLTNIASHIIDNGWVLRDMDGQPTRWGRWDPDYLFRPYGYVARGLNGMQAQTYMHAAFAVSGDEKYKKGLEQVLEWGYHHYTVRQKITFPPDDIATWDDNLAQYCYYTLFRYADDPYLLSIYLRSLERTWALKRMEKIPWYNFSYGAITGNDCEAEEAVQHLREWTLDCIEHSYQNSHRDDLYPEPGYVAYGGGTRAMSPRETSVKRGSRDALPYDGGADGRRVIEPTGFLRDYWMGRYHGFIAAPTVADPALISVPELPGSCGAAPYAGPARPAF